MSRTAHLRLPFFDAKHRAFADEIDQWAGDTAADIGHGDDIDATCVRWVRALGAAGWLQYCVPAACGGAHDTLQSRYLVIARETLAWHSGLADFAFAMQGLGSGPITLAGSDELKQRYLPRVAAGAGIAAFALSEIEAGSDVAALSTSARLVDGHYVLDGEKTWISNGGIADFYAVFARSGEAPGARGISAFVVDADTPGLEIAQRIDVTAPHPLARLRFQLLPRSGLQPHRQRRAKVSRSPCARSIFFAPPWRPRRLVSPAARSTRRSGAPKREKCSARRSATFS